MKFYDLHIHSEFSGGTSSLEQLAEMVQNLNYFGFCFTSFFKNDAQIKKLETEIERIKRKFNLEIFLGFEARDTKDLMKLIERRRRFDLLLVHGGDLKLNRLAVENPEVDILAHPEMNRNDSGLNHVLMKMAKKHNVAIEINFKQILTTSKKSRGRVLSNMQNNVKLAKKFKVPITITSGAYSHWEIIDPQVLSSFGTLLGLELIQGINSVSKIPENIMKQSKERRNEKWVMPGVKVVK